MKNLSSLGLASALFIFPATATRAEPQSSDAVYSGSLFLLTQIETSKILSRETFTGILNQAVESASGDIGFKVGFRCDWAGVAPGALGTEYCAFSSASLFFKPNPDLKISVGTIGFKGPVGTELVPVKGTDVFRYQLSFGGPIPGLIGLDAGYKDTLFGLPVTWDYFLGTRDPIEQSLAGADFAVICGKNTQTACGVTSGLKLTVNLLQDLQVIGSFTYVGNGGNLANEERFNFAAIYTIKLGNTFTFTGTLSGNQVFNYLGTHDDFMSLTEIAELTATINDHCTAGPYVRATQSNGAVRSAYTYVGGMLTCKVEKNTTLTAAPYVGREDVQGTGGRQTNAAGVWGTLLLKW